MKVTLLLVGKTVNNYLKDGIKIYEKRIKHYIPFSIKSVPGFKNVKKHSAELHKVKEGRQILNNINQGDEVFLLDEKGFEYTSLEFSNFIEKKIISGIKNLIFVIGGAYGFSNEVYKRANGQLTLPKMTFSHQLVRLIFLEQIYRAMTILKGEPYHHS